MSTTQDPRAWQVAIALALESGLDWARWARGAPRSSGYSRDGIFWGGDGAPVPAPWDADAYRADCARRGVDPGPLPSLEHDNPTGYEWRVVSWSSNSGGQRMRVEMLWYGRLLCTWAPDSLQFIDDGCCHRVHAAVFVRLATAAAKAMVP